MKNVLVLSVVTLLVLHLAGLALGAADRKMVVGVTVTDLRAQPIKMNPISYAYDPLQLSQLVFNEQVNVLNESNGWYYVQALQQPNYVNGQWGPYLGYIQKQDLIPVQSFPRYNLVVASTVAELFSRSCHLSGCLPDDIHLRLSIGTWLEGVDQRFGWWRVKIPADNSKGFVEGWVRADELRYIHPIPKGDALRHDLVESSKEMLGWYYFWGGRSAFVSQLWDSKTVLTGVDCSGLVGTVYRSYGILLPRDAQPMFVKSQNVTDGPKDLKAGDLFFFASPKRPDHMFHVMMYIGDGRLVESATNSTRIMEVETNFGVPIEQLTWGHKVPSGNAMVYWGRFIDN